jgi:hypothetical protein
MTDFFDLRNSFCHSISLSLLRVTGEDQVAGFYLRVAGKAGVEYRLVGRFAVVEVTEPPATCRRVLWWD